MYSNDKLNAKATLPTGENRRYPQNSKVGGHNSRSGPWAEQKKVLPLLHIDPPLPGHVKEAQALLCKKPGGCAYFYRTW
jgi:hypothetical protein